MSCIKLRLWEKRTQQMLGFPQSSLPWICDNKAAEGKCHRRIILDGPAWMNNYRDFDSGQGDGGKDTRPHTLSAEEPCIMTCDRTPPPPPPPPPPRRLWHAEMLQKEKDFSCGKTLGEMKWFIPAARYVLLLTKMRRGHGGFICAGRGGGSTAADWLGPASELTAVVSGRKQGFGDASLSPLCLIIWMTSQCVTHRHSYGGWRGLLEMTPPMMRVTEAAN